MAADTADKSAHLGWAAFRHRDFVIVFSTGILSNMGIFAMQICIGWEMWETTREEFYLGLVGLFSFLPMLILFPISGMVADRFPRRLVLAVCYGGQAVSAVVLLIVFTLDTVHPVAALGVIALTGVGRAFAQPAGHALLPNVVPPEHLANAVAWSSSGRQLSMVAGPALGGALLVFGAGPAFAGIAGLFAFAMILISLVRVQPAAQPRGPITLEFLFGGLKFIYQRQIVLGAVSLDFIAVMAGTAFALLPIYASDVLGVGELGLGFLRSTWAVGATACALMLTHIAIRDRAGYALFATVAVFGLAMTIFGLSTILWLSVAALFVAGAADMVSVYIRDNLVQMATPDEMRGRVQAANSVFTMGSSDLGQLKSGFLAEAIGVVPSVVVGGLGVVGVVALWMKLFPRLRTMRGLDPDSIREAARLG